jgi:hypothetical protein
MLRTLASLAIALAVVGYSDVTASEGKPVAAFDVVVWDWPSTDSMDSVTTLLESVVHRLPG